MFIALYLFWLLLEGQWNTEIALTGAALCALLYWFSWRFLGYTPRREWQLIRRIPAFIAYIGLLIAEIVKSGLTTIHYIWSPMEIVQPRLVSIRPRLKTATGRVLLANSITMTPGTITVDILDDQLLVHCLDETMAEGLEDSEMVRRIADLEEGRFHANPA